MIPAIPTTLHADPELRELLLAHYFAGCASAGLADWLRDIGQDARGSSMSSRATPL